MPLSMFFSSSRPVNTIDALLRKSGLSLRTLRRRMKEAEVISSYNANSAFYTLPSLAEFGPQGIWHYRQASFSVWGSLTATIKHLVDKSVNGYVAAELSGVLHVRTDDHLRILAVKGDIGKTRLASRNIYISIDNEISRKQISERKRLLREVFPAKWKLPRDKDRIIILIEIILTEKLTVDPKDICRNLNRKGYAFKPEVIEDVIACYGLKKTR